MTAACGRIGFSSLSDDGGIAGDGSSVPSVFHDLADTASWSVYDVGLQIGGAQGFLGGAFDGRYAYFVPNAYGVSPNGLVTRYDTRAPFDAPAAWEGFDVTTVGGAAAAGFCTGAFDGRYLYFTPSTGTVAARFDTQGAGFADASSWATFDLAAVAAGASRFQGTAYDGHYLYFIPGSTGGLVTRYDPQLAFTAAASWTTFDTTTVDPSASGFDGVVFDGRYLYLVPGRFDVAVAARFDTTAAFTSAAAWSVFDITTLPVADTGFSGGTFDGRYIYYAPYYDNTVYQGVATRYDTHGAFTDAAAWETFDLTAANTDARGFNGASFDGRYVYLVENQFGASKIVARHDSLAPFDAGWSVFDVTGVPDLRSGYHGAVFDGEYMYFVPFSNGNSGVVARFDAKTPPALPADWHASFF